MLTEVLAQNPTDAFARYGLAMEYRTLEKFERALEEFGRLLATHPDYTAGYFMAARPWPKLSATKKLGRCWWTDRLSRKPGMATPSRKWKACSRT